MKLPSKNELFLIFIKGFELRIRLDHFNPKSLRMWTYIFLIACALAAPTYSCTDEEFEATQSSENGRHFLIHSFEDVLNGSMSRVALLKLVSISENDRQLPVIFDTRTLRMANTRLHSESHPEMCSALNRNDSFARRFFLSPPGSMTAGILYGCNVKSFENAMFFFYDEHRWDAEKPRYHKRSRTMSLSFKFEICTCKKTLERFTKNCLVAKVAREAFKRNLLVFGALSLFICIFFIGYVLRKLWLRI